MGFIQKLIVKFMQAPFLSNQIGILLRHGLSLLSGWLIAHGVAENLVTNFTGASFDLIMGSITLLLAWIFSTVNKQIEK